MNILLWLFDSLLCLGLIWLAWNTLACPDLFKAIVLFIAFGLLMSLTWVRLEAPDIALAEVAIGAGLTGALLLAALARLRFMTKKSAPKQSEINEPVAKPSLYLQAIILTLTTAGLGLAILSLHPYAPGLSADVSAKLATSGVGNPVTAVLLNFRGYDTLLEMFVLLVALLGVWSLSSEPLQHEAASGPVLDNLSRLLTPVLILVSAYLLWVGANAPGGAFQAGSVLAAAGVLMLLTGWRLPARLLSLPLRLTLVAGPAAFVSIAMFTFLLEKNLLEYPPEYAGVIILFLETMATLSIGITLAALFLGGHPGDKKEPS